MGFERVWRDTVYCLVLLYFVQNWKEILACYGLVDKGPVGAFRIWSQNFGIQKLGKWRLIFFGNFTFFKEFFHADQKYDSCKNYTCNCSLSNRIFHFLWILRRIRRGLWVLKIINFSLQNVRTCVLRVIYTYISLIFLWWLNFFLLRWLFHAVRLLNFTSSWRRRWFILNVFNHFHFSYNKFEIN